MKRIKLAICTILLFVCSPFLFAACLTFTNFDCNLGRIVEGEKKFAYFYFTNESENDIKITNTRATCGCIVVFFEKFNNKNNSYDEKFPYNYGVTIPAHSKGRISARFNSSGRPGRFRKTVIVCTPSDTTKLQLYGEVVPADENTTFKRTYKYTIGEHQEIGFRGLHYSTSKGYRTSKAPIQVSKNNIYKTKVGFIVLSDSVDNMDVILDKNEEALSWEHSIDTLKNGRMENVLTFTFDTKKTTQEWGIVEKEVAFLINGKNVKEHLYFQYDILEDTVHLSKQELKLSPKLQALNTYKNKSNPIWEIGSYDIYENITYTIKLQNIGKRPLIFRDKPNKGYSISVMKLGNNEPVDIEKIIQDKHYEQNYFHMGNIGNDAQIKISKSIVNENEIVELTIYMLIPESGGLLIPDDALIGGIEGFCKYNLIEIGPIRTNDPYHNFIYLYFLYSLKENDLTNINYDK